MLTLVTNRIRCLYSRPEFLEICLEKLWTIPTPVLVVAGKNFATAQRIVTEAPNTYWKEVAQNIDSWYRLVVPIAYSLLLSVLYNLKFNDGYDTDHYQMWGGFNCARVFETPLCTRLDSSCLIAFAAGRLSSWI